MGIHKSIQADSAGRVNLGKDCAGLLFILSCENNRFVLEPARVVPEKEFQAKQIESERILLNEEEWAKFEEIIEAEDKPKKNLRNLMKKQN